MASKHVKTSIPYLTVISVLFIGYACAQQEWSPWRPPWNNFVNNVVVESYYGWIQGFSVPWHVEDEAWNPEWDEIPRWYVQRVNCFLGVPYALPPVGELRWRQPRRPRWGGTWDASYFRNSCPQRLEKIREDIPDYPRANISEDCLYLNVFAPNITWHSRETLYPVMVFIHPGEWTHGSAQLWPGHVLATREVVVVTLNYRLGALGFMTLEDEHAPGNWGLFDQHLAMEFIKENIKAFKGDPNKITLMGSGVGGASVGIHMVSPITSGKGFFHQAAAMGATDLSQIAYIEPYWRPREYGIKLGKLLNCPVDDSYLLMECLRNNKTISWRAILDAQEKIYPNSGAMGQVWAPVQDGGYYNTWAFLPETPLDLRRQHKFDNMPFLTGLNGQQGVQKANASIRGLGTGLFLNTFRDFMERTLEDWKIMDDYRQRAYEAVEFQYTWWPDPENKSARTQEFINLNSDWNWGVGVDEVVKLQAEYGDWAYQYEFRYKSWNDYLPKWMGVGEGAELPYVFGVPFMNETILNETEIVPRQWYDYDDRNISDFMLLMWSNFAKYGQPTVNVTRNVTWDPFNHYNLSYLVIDEHSYNWFRYRQSKYGFWRDYFPLIARQDYLIPTATPTPAGRDYKYTTAGVAAMLIVCLVIVGLCVYLLILQSRKDREEEAFAEADLPISFSQTFSVSSGATKRSYVHSNQSEV